MELHLTATECHLPLWDHTVLPSTRHAYEWTHPTRLATTQ